MDRSSFGNPGAATPFKSRSRRPRADPPKNESGKVSGLEQNDHKERSVSAGNETCIAAANLSNES